MKRRKRRGAKHVQFTSSRTTGTSKRATAGAERDGRRAGVWESEAWNEDIDPTRGRFEDSAPSSRASEGACDDVKDSRVDDRLPVGVVSDDSK